MSETLLQQNPAPGKPRKQGYWRIVWRQFKRNRLAMFGLGLVLFLGVVALVAPYLANDVPLYVVVEGESYVLPYLFEPPELIRVDWKTWKPGPGEYVLRPPVPYSPYAQFLLERVQGPSPKHWLGTDDRGRDVLTRLIWGTRISMSIGFVAVGISIVVGAFFGALSGYYGGWIDIVIQRFIEIMMCFPSFFFLLAIIAFLPRSIFIIMAAIGLLGWMGVARLVRGEFLKLRDGEFAVAARASGLRDSRVMFRHLLPNALAPVLVSATFGIAGAILTESGLSFLGFGVQPPMASWGELLKQSHRLLGAGVWWLVLFPGAAIFITVTAFNLVGEGLRDAMDPRLRQ